MTPSFRERVKEKLNTLHELPSWNVDDEVAEILSLVRGIVPSSLDPTKEYGMGWNAASQAILNEIGEGDATRKHDGGL